MQEWQNPFNFYISAITRHLCQSMEIGEVKAEERRIKCVGKQTQKKRKMGLKMRDLEESFSFFWSKKNS